MSALPGEAPRDGAGAGGGTSEQPGSCGCAGEALQTKHRVGADLFGVSPTGLPAPAQKPILMGWMLSFISPAVCWLGEFPWVTCISRRIGQCVGSSGCLAGFAGCSPSSSVPVPCGAPRESPVIRSPISPLVAAGVVVHDTAAWLVLELGSLQGITCLLLEPARSEEEGVCTKLLCSHEEVLLCARNHREHRASEHGSETSHELKC